MIKTDGSSTPRTTVILLLGALGVVLLLCICGVTAYIVLNTTGLITTQVNFLATGTPTQATSVATPTSLTVGVATSSATLKPSGTAALATATPAATETVPSTPPTSQTPETYLAFDANLNAGACPLFEGDNETRVYKCESGEYSMLHKQATTRYSYIQGEYEDAVVEANGHFVQGNGKYEYGIIFRGNTDGTLYYVFTVANDGKYNVAVYKNDKYTDLIPYTASPLVRIDDSNFFRVIMRGSHFDFYLNDEYLNSVTDTTIQRGVVGLFFYNAEPGAEVVFDQLTVSTFTPPTPTGTPDANATPTAVQTPVTPAVFTDDFAGECILFEGDNETRAYKCRNGEYTMLHKTGTDRWSVYVEEYDNGVFEADGHFISGTGSYEYGLVLRATDNPWQYYGFTVTGSGKYSIFLYKDGKYTDLVPYTESPAVKTGTDINHFRVIARGGQFQFYLNGQHLTTVSDATLTKGTPGFYLNNKEPNVQVGFDNFSITGVDQSPATPTSATAVPTKPPVAPTVAIKPGVYVTSLRFSPGAPKRGQPVTFFANFVNSTGRAQSYKWLVEIWEANTNKKNPYGQADGLQREVTVGTHELKTGDSWKVAGGGPCQPFRARVVYENDQSQRIPFKRTNGADLWIQFQVCP